MLKLDYVYKHCQHNLLGSRYPSETGMWSTKLNLVASQPIQNQSMLANLEFYFIFSDSTKCNLAEGIPVCPG
jgi:hypothetical protein